MLLLLIIHVNETEKPVEPLNKACNARPVFDKEYINDVPSTHCARIIPVLLPETLLNVKLIPNSVLLGFGIVIVKLDVVNDTE